VSALEGRHRWLTNMSTVAVALGLIVATAYVFVTVTLPEGSGLSFGLVMLGIAVVFNTLADVIEQRRLLTLRGLGEGVLPPTKEHLVAAAREAVQMPQTGFWLSLSLLSLGPVTLGFCWSRLAEVPLPVVMQVSFLGVIVAPVTATLVLLVSIPRARQVLRELVAAGLPATALYDAMPVQFVLRRRLMAFAAVSVFTPLVLVGDLAISRLRGLLTALVAAPDADAMQAVAAAQRSEGLVPLLGLVVLVVLLVSLTAWLSGSILGGPLQELATETERLAKGQHTEPRFIPAEYETFAAAGAIAAMETQLLALLSRLGSAAGDLTGATGELESARGNGAGRGDLGAASGTTVELARSARDVADNAQRVSELARQTLTAARAGRDGADGFLAAMGQVRDGNQAIADSVVRLNKRVQQVGRIIEFIDGIADKSDLLALNAELEGNKAGEVGRGFSLVAAEMRRLAESVMQSTREIAGLIDEIRDATNAAVMATEAGVKATDAGSALAQKVGAGLSKIVDYANQSADAMQSISLATAQQQAGTDQLVGAMKEIVQSKQASDEAAMQMRAALTQLLALSKDLQATAARFEVQP
jgi:methyl-accepting chemotaxis protein